MKTVRWLILLAVWIPCQARSYSDFSARCLPRDIGYLELEAALLWWKVSSPGFFLGTTPSKALVLPTKYQAGARFAIRYFSRDQCRYLAFSWTHYDRLTEERSLTAAITTPDGAAATRLYEANLKFEYNCLELLVGQQVLCIDRLNLNLFAGLTGSRMLQRHQVNYDPEGWLRARVVFEGIGPEAGVSMQYHLWQGCGILDFAGRASASYLLGERRRDPEGGLTFQSITEWIPAFYARGGIRWGYQAACFRVLIEAGYEIRHYADAFLRNTHPAGTDDSFAKDFTLGGPYFCVRVRF